ncbi:MAG TPA: Ran-binding zinc finger domain-containing protein [Longimicrobiaceae bacterium]|nr:Ran-binding zinc finger domain-containing protein [Longimicrobiaceae bacterium]
MNTPLSTEAPTAVETLTAQRSRLQEWLGRLGEVGSDVPPHVAERVRRDYEDRLRDVTQQLSEHLDALTGELDDRRTELDDAEARRAGAQDDLQEARLRHLIGEVEDGDWEARRPELESAVADAEAEAARVRGEVDRLEALLRDVGASEAAAAPAADAAQEEPAAEAAREAEPEPFGEPEWAREAPGLPPRDTSDDTIPEFTPHAGSYGANGGGAAEGSAHDDLDVDLSWLEDVEQVSATSVDLSPAAGAAPAAADTSADDLAFLAELDRAIAHSTHPEQGAAPAASSSVGGTDDRTLDPDRAGMLLCKECGAINEPQLWYCEICGSEL